MTEDVDTRRLEIVEARRPEIEESAALVRAELRDGGRPVAVLIAEARTGFVSLDPALHLKLTNEAFRNLEERLVAVEAELRAARG